MQFCEQLGEYMKQYNISAKELSDISGLSPSVISRYKSGRRIPAAGSEQISMLAYGIAHIGISRGDDTTTADTIYNTLSSCIADSSGYTKHQAGNLNILIEALKINTVEMAKAINYDPSFISRVRKNKRIPSNVESFIRKISSYAAVTYDSKEDIRIMAECMNCSTDRLETVGIRQLMLEQWLSEKNTETDSAPIQRFLSEIDDFNFDDYMRKIHFDDIRIPTKPFQLPSSRNYYGVKAMKQGELDFIKATVFSRSRKPVYMYSDMPMEDMGNDEEFRKKYILGLGMMIRKGLHLHVIHNLNRPFEEIMMGLSGWIPLYMTGQISPYYFDRIANPVFSQLNNVSGAAALDGQCVGNDHESGKYYLTNNRQELKYYQKRADNMINAALPLMTIYRAPQKADFQKMWSTEMNRSGTYLRISYSLPIYTIPEELLNTMLVRHKVNDSDRKMLLTKIHEQKKNIQNLLKNGKLQDVVCNIPDDEFDSHPPFLSLNNIFYERNLDYTKEEYRKHLEASIKFSRQHENYSFKLSDNYDFRNIELLIHRKKWVILSKNHSPIIHFVIRHPLLQNALEKLAQYYV